MLRSSFAPVLFESTDSVAVLSDLVNVDWLSVVHCVDGPAFDLLARQYYLALNYLRSKPRPALPGTVQVHADGCKAAHQAMLELIVQRKNDPSQDAEQTFVNPRLNDEDPSMPKALKDLSLTPPRLSDLLSGPGRPPIDALCMMRAFLAAPLLGVPDSPEAVFRLLHSNPTFARACGFAGPTAVREPFEYTSRRLPALSTVAEFDEVMTRYGLWHHARLLQVQHNLSTGVVPTEDTLVFDTTHVMANSHCANVVAQEQRQEPPQDQNEQKQKVKHRKVPRVCKACDCGKAQWETCPHPWSPTDQGAAVVVKGPTRIYWAHKASVASFGSSEIPIDVRVLSYAAYSDGKTLIPHLVLLQSDLPTVVDALQHILADSAYRENKDKVVDLLPGRKLHVTITSRKVKPAVAEAFAGIDRFTDQGVPICRADYRLELLGRDIQAERYIWLAPEHDDGQPVCVGCPFASECLTKGARRHIRVPRQLTPQIDWDYPQHFATEKIRYAKRTGVERAIKRIKVDLKGDQLTHRDAPRVQAHLDRKLLTLHLLLACRDSS